MDGEIPPAPETATFNIEIFGVCQGLMILPVLDIENSRPLSEPMTLSELADRYADVVSLTEALDYLGSL